MSTDQVLRPAPCGQASPAYYSPATPETDDEPAVVFGHIYFACGCVVRSDGRTTCCGVAAVPSL